MTKTIVVVAIHDWATDTFLVSKRPSTGEWEFPGGHLEAEEHPRVGAVREVREETSLLIKPDDLTDVMIMLECRSRHKPSDPFTLILFYASVFGGVATPQPPETTELAWLPLDASVVLSNCALAHPAAVSAIKVFLTGRSYCVASNPKEI